MDDAIWSGIKAISPVMVLCGGAFLLLLLEVFLKERWPRGSVTALTLIGALVAALLVPQEFATGKTLFMGMIHADPFSWFFTVFLILGSLMSLLMMLERLPAQGVEARSEFYSLLLMATAGAILFVSSAELITLFLGLEIMSMALYCLCGAALGSRRSTEAALKYFLLGSFSSAFLLYGIALLYGVSGSTTMNDIAAKVGSVDQTLLAFAIGLTLVGLVFKLGAVPFHFWAPDVYQGAPTSVTAYMACVIKASAVAVILRVLWVTFGEVNTLWSDVIWLVAILTMVLGNVIAVRQRNVKRLLAYSSIAHAGYLSAAFLVPSNQFGGGSAILYYLVAYTLMTMGAFGVVLAVTGDDQEGAYADDIVKFHGLGRTRPGLAALMTIFLLSLAGLPPGMAGLLGKFYVFSAVVKGGYLGLAIVGVLASAISCFYYLRIIVAMYFLEPMEEERLRGVHAGEGLGVPLGSLLGLCATGVLLFGIFPEHIYRRAAIIMNSILGGAL